MRRRDPGTAETPVTKFGGLGRFLEATTPPAGPFLLTNQKIPIDFFHDDVGSDTLVVFFHGAVRKGETGPWFVGESAVKGLNANRLSISDPSLYLDDDLTLGWFIGSNRQNDMQGLISKVIAHLVKMSGVKHLIFMGGSGGGFAALDMSRRFPGSLALPMNPQTSIRLHRPSTVAQYLRTAWGNDIDYPDKLPGYAVHDQVTAYRLGQDNTVAYIQNSRDSRHIKDHMTPFMDVAGGRPETWLLMDSWGDPAGSSHVPPPKLQVHEILSGVVSAGGDWDRVLPGLGFSRT